MPPKKPTRKPSKVTKKATRKPAAKKSNTGKIPLSEYVNKAEKMGVPLVDSKGKRRNREQLQRAIYHQNAKCKK